ncbi:MAG TPA: DNA-directed RNA polymerase subunit alpha [Chloroflexia bacterium]|nr:DNA-directed RNA polymerase subunit alpha [Chloroflexia bacterium]
MSNGRTSSLPNVVAVATAPNYGRFAIGPVEVGIGVTLGNALRRILLSSLPGSAITSVRIQNVYHEFSCIPSVREDVTEIVLNIKNIRLRSYSERAVRLNLAKHGDGEVRAGDIELPANVELVNPELVLATLDGPDAHLELELTVERGRGYVSFESREGMPIGTIPVDAIFSPIPKVNYLVEPANAEMLSVVPDEQEEGSENGVVTLSPEDVEGREQLLIEIWTDGTIDPGEALSLSAQYLFQHSQLISGFNKQAAPTGRDLPGAVSIPAHLFEMPIEDLSLSMRTYNCLKRSGITKVGQVLRMDKKELLGLRNFGDKSFDELHQSLLTRDLIPPGTPLDLSSREEGEEGEGIEGELETGEYVGYAEYDQADEPDAYIEQTGETVDGDVSSAQIVDAAGVSEGSMEAAAGIFIDDEPASEDVDILPGDNETDLGEAEAAPKARSRKKS